MGERKLQNIMVTGGAGFIGSNIIRYDFNQPDFSGMVINVDKLTYAGNPENLSDIDQAYGVRYFFEHLDICDAVGIRELFERFEIDTIVHFAAESHVDRSILRPAEFIRTNVMGTFNLLEVARENWAGHNDILFHHVSVPMRFTELSEITDIFLNIPPMIPGVRILRPRRLPTTLSERIIIPMVCRSRFPIAVIITGLFNSRKN
jgi:dTDP-glucose 4,6-dehydratase